MKDQLLTFAHAMLLFTLMAALGGLSFALAVELQPLAKLATATPARVTTASAAVVPTPLPQGEPNIELSSRKLAFPVQGLSGTALQDNFDQPRGKRRHQALDIMASRGTPVRAIDDGSVAKLYRHALGGITIYQFDAQRKYAYYYAHLDGYAPGLAEGDAVKRGQVIGYVGSTGNAPEHAPHLHFAIYELDDSGRWWKGRAVNPYPYLAMLE